MSTSCAYCGHTGRITKEHIFPKCLIDRLPSYTARYSSKPHKWFEAELIVKDVCSECNNGILSSLDAYICGAHDTFFRSFAREGEAVEFRYEYKMLTRWLLKVSYNSARIGGHDTHVLRTYVPYIMGQEDEPENISFLVKLVKPTGIWEKSRGSIRRNEMLPTGCHIGELKFSGDRFGWTVTRVVSINSYHFFLVITPDPNASVSQKEIHDYTRYLHNVKS